VYDLLSLDSCIISLKITERLAKSFNVKVPEVPGFAWLDSTTEDVTRPVPQIKQHSMENEVGWTSIDHTGEKGESMMFCQQSVKNSRATSSGANDKNGFNYFRQGSASLNCV